MKARLTVLSVLMVALVPNAAYAHWTAPGVDSVDGSEIRYEDHTQYDDARTWAINRWNALNTIDILPDAWNTNNDLDFEDVAAGQGVPWVGQWIYNPAPGTEDKIQFNTSWIEDPDEGYTTSKKRNIAMHELGHALGLEHSWTPNVMNAWTTSDTSLASHDICSYDHRWNNPNNWCGDPH